MCKVARLWKWTCLVLHIELIFFMNLVVQISIYCDSQKLFLSISKNYFFSSKHDLTKSTWRNLPDETRTSQDTSRPSLGILQDGKDAWLNPAAEIRPLYPASESDTTGPQTAATQRRARRKRKWDTNKTVTFSHNFAWGRKCFTNECRTGILRCMWHEFDLGVYARVRDTKKGLAKVERGMNGNE